MLLDFIVISGIAYSECSLIAHAVNSHDKCTFNTDIAYDNTLRYV